MIGSQLRTRRERLGMTQTELAVRWWNDPSRQSHIARWESGAIAITTPRPVWSFRSAAGHRSAVTTSVVHLGAVLAARHRESRE